MSEIQIELMQRGHALSIEIGPDVIKLVGPETPLLTTLTCMGLLYAGYCVGNALPRENAEDLMLKILHGCYESPAFTVLTADGVITGGDNDE